MWVRARDYATSERPDDALLEGQSLAGAMTLTSHRLMAKLAITSEGGSSMPNVSLTPEQLRFIEARVASGRFASASEVIRHSVRMMQDAEERRDRFVAMLCDVSARADREGTISAEDVDAQLTAVIAAAKRRS